MSGLVEDYAEKVGWKIAQCNVIVEGTSDVDLIRFAARCYAGKHSVDLLGSELGILHAGYGDEGGVAALNLKLTVARQLSVADLGPDGGVRYRFIGLYDNDRAGRNAAQIARNIDRSLYLCRDLFLLHPIMPLASGANHLLLQQRFQSENVNFKSIDWEIEDFVSERLIAEFEREFSTAILSSRKSGGRTHREFSAEGKSLFRKYVLEYGRLDDLKEIVKLIRALRDYHKLKIDHVIC